MPQASEELRKLWHDKRVWQKLHPSIDRKSIGAICLPGWGSYMSYGHKKTGLVWFAWVVNGDAAARLFLQRQGYREYRAMWYRPKFGQHSDKWSATRKETTALCYLCDEWDESYDLRKPRIILDALRNEICEKIDKGMRAGNRFEMDRLISFFKRYETLVRVLS